MNKRGVAGLQQSREKVRIGIANQQRGLKNTIATDHTAGAPSSRGSTILANMGCTENRSSAERNKVPA